MEKGSTEVVELQQFVKQYPSDALSIIYGRGGAGKTTLCFLAMIAQLQAGKKVLFLDAGKNFSWDRVEQLYPEVKTKSENLLVLPIKNFNVQHQHIKELANVKKIDLIIVDSMTTYYRRLNAREPELAKAMLGRQLSILQELAIKEKIPIIVTSEVYSDMQGGTLPIAKDVLLPFGKRVIKLEREQQRRIVQERPEKQVISFLIETSGIKQL